MLPSVRPARHSRPTEFRRALVVIRKSPDRSSLAMIAVFAAALASASGWAVDRLLIGPPCTAAAATAITCGSIAALAFLIGWRMKSGRDGAVHRYLQGLERLSDGDVAGQADPTHFPPPKDVRPFASTLDQLRRHWADVGERLLEAEEAQALAEVRSRAAQADGERLADIVGHLADPVIAVDQHDEITLANDEARTLLGLCDDDLARPVDEVITHQELVDAVKDVRRRRGYAQRRVEMEMSDADGAPRHFQALVRRESRGVAGEGSAASAGVIAVLRDVSRERAIQRRNAEFVSAASHEMKTPLAGIRAYVELLLDGDAEDEETRDEFLGIINSQADRLQRLINNLLNLARIEAGAVEVNKQQHSVNELLEEATSVVQHSATEKGTELTSDLSPMYLGSLVDRDMILQSAINLLSNAIKYTPSGGSVTLRSRHCDDEVQFEVVDTGVGLDAEDCENVFKKFYRVNKDSHMAAGTGLGLPLAKHIVEDVHGGRLTVESEPGKGSVFSVTLPACSSQIASATVS